MSKEKNEPFRCPQHYREWSRFLDRAWNQALPSQEFTVVRFIFDRTAGWGKEWERIPVHHFTKCVIGGNGTNYGGIHATSKGTVRRALASLVTKGAVLREPSGRSFRYSLNYNWNPSMKSGKITNSRKGSTPSPSDGPTPDPLRGQPLTTKEKGIKEPSGKGRERSAQTDVKEELDKRVKAVRKRSRERRAEKKKQTVKTKRGVMPTAGAVTRTWVDLHNEHHKGKPCAPLSDRARHMVRSYCKEWNARNPDDDFLTDYLPWLFANWTIIGVTSLGWMTDSPEVPQPMFVANSKMRPHLEEGWGKRVWFDQLRKMSPRDREVAVLMDRGVDKETAERMATERKTTDDQIKRLRQEQAKLDVMKQYGIQAPADPKKRVTRSVRPTNEGLPGALPSWDTPNR